MPIKIKLGFFFTSLQITKYSYFLDVLALTLCLPEHPFIFDNYEGINERHLSIRFYKLLDSENAYQIKELSFLRQIHLKHT